MNAQERELDLMVAELEQENRLLRARNDRLEAERTWAGLTGLEHAEFVKTMERGNFLVAIYDIETKLKEKNT